MKVRRGATGNFIWLVQILIVTILVLILQPNRIHIPNIGVTSCPLGDSPQILNVQKHLCLYTLFQRNLQILESSKCKQTIILDLNHMPLHAFGSSRAQQTPQTAPSPLVLPHYTSPTPPHTCAPCSGQSPWPSRT